MVTAGQVVPKEDAEPASSAPAAGDEAIAGAVSKTGEPDGKKGSVKGMGKVQAELYHERVGCGLFWAVGKFRPTNYMIVSVLTILLETPTCYSLHVLCLYNCRLNKSGPGMTVSLLSYSSVRGPSMAILASPTTTMTTSRQCSGTTSCRQGEHASCNGLVKASQPGDSSLECCASS